MQGLYKVYTSVNTGVYAGFIQGLDTGLNRLYTRVDTGSKGFIQEGLL